MRLRDAALVLACLVLLVPAGLLTVNRLTEPPWARAVQAVAFTPFAIPLYAAGLLLLGVVMLVRHTVALAYVVPAALAAAGLVLHSWWFAPLVAGDAPEPAAGAEPVVVMTANILRGRADTADLMKQVREHHVDVLVVSEITESSLAAMEAAGLSTLLPYGEGRPGLDETVTGTMVFSDEPIELVDVLDTTMDCLVVDTGGIRIVGVHPSPPVSPGRWRDDHATILGAVEERDPDLLVGDFNATLDQEPMRELQEVGYRDAIELTNGGFQPTWPQDGGFGLVGLFGASAQIDHVMVGAEWTVTEAETTGLDDSDHKPVVATVARR